MAYSELRVVNMALQRLGIARIASGDWSSPSTEQALAAYAVFEEIRNEVLEAGDWVFAKTRTTLSQIPPRVELNVGDNKRIYIQADKYDEDAEDISVEIYTNSSDALSVVEDPDDSKNIIIKLANSTTTKNTAALIQTALRALATVNGVDVSSWTVTVNATWTTTPPTTGVDLDEVEMKPAALYESYDRAYLLPSDFLKVCTPKPGDMSVDPTGGYGTVFDEEKAIIRVRGLIYPFIIESLPDDRKILLTDYDSDEDDPLELVYIRTSTDPTKWTAHFITALAFRLAADLALPLTEDKNKFANMFALYQEALSRARAVNYSGDQVADETGSTSWELAGR